MTADTTVDDAANLILTLQQSTEITEELGRRWQEEIAKVESQVASMLARCKKVDAYILKHKKVATPNVE